MALSCTSTVHATLQRRLALPLTLLGLAWTAPAQNPLWTLQGETLAERAGSAVAGIGDVDGDGFDDVAVGTAPELPAGIGVVRVYSGRTGLVLRTLSGLAAGDGFGVSVAGAGDVNNDGTPDVIVGASPTVATPLKGYVRLFSGKDWSVLRYTAGAAAGDWFGAAVDGIGDADGDGHDDYIVGAPFGDGTITDAGSVYLFSGRTGTALQTWHGEARFDQFGFAAAGAGDVDRDGVPDVIAGAHGNDKLAVDAGAASVFSGKTGRLLVTWRSSNFGDGFGFSVAGPGDVDKDGWPDLLVGALWEGPALTDTGSAQLYSGRTLTMMRKFVGPSNFDGLGTSVAGAGDVDGDGFVDFMAGAVQAFPPGRGGYVRVWSGKTMQELHVFRGLQSGDYFGRAVAPAGDVNGDGVADIIAGAPHASAQQARGGTAWVIAGNHVGLKTDRGTVSVTNGGVQILSLDARAVHANKLYWVFGTSGATTPGNPWGRITVPLTIDPYFEITLVSPNTPLLRLTLGQLDSQGKATAFFRLPPGLPQTLVGLKLHHSFVVFDLATIDLQFASLPAPLDLVR